MEQAQHEQHQSLSVSDATPQETIDIAKKKNLDSVDEPEADYAGDDSTAPRESSSPTKNNRPKWILLVVSAIIIFLIVIILSLKNSLDASKYSDGCYENELSTAVAEENGDNYMAFSNDSQANFEDRFETRNPWHKEYLLNEWGEEDTTHPMLVTHIIGESLWNIRIEYIPPTDNLPFECFRVYITEDGAITSMYGPAEILVRGADGETHNVEIGTIEDYAAYIIDSSNVNMLKNYLNQDEFEIRINFEKWNERHHTQGRWWSDAGFFQKAINTLL